MAAQIVQMPAVVEPAMLRVITYPTNDEVIAKLAAECVDLSADTTKGYEEVRVAIGNLRSLRVSVEERRVELKASALEYGRKVDREAKRLTGLIEAIESPLREKKQAIDDEKAARKAAEEQARLDALREEIRQREEQQAAERKAAQEAEDRRLAEERAALEVERQRLADERRIADEKAAADRAAADEAQRLERAQLDAERAEIRARQEAEEARLRAEREALEAERRTVEAARQQAEREEAARLARQRAEQEARDRAERERIAAEEARVAEVERQAALQARLDALRPDVEKLTAFAEQLRAITPPAVTSIEAREWLNDTLQAIALAADSLDERATSQEASFS